MSSEIILLSGPVTRLARAVFRACTSLSHDVVRGAGPQAFDADDEPIGFALSDALPARVVFADWAHFSWLWCECRQRCARAAA